MAKRGIIRAFCSGGFRHETRGEAKAHAANLARRGVVRDCIPKCKQCLECGGWHVQRHGDKPSPGTLGEALLAAGVGRG